MLKFYKSNHAIIPIYISKNDWFSSLNATYSTDFLPVLLDNDDWKSVATTIATTGTFLRIKVPLPDDYNEWNEWAMDVYRCLIKSNE